MDDALHDSRDVLHHPSRPHGDTDEPRERILWGLLLIVVAFVAYGPALRGGFLWDDDRHISENQMLHTTRGLARIWTELGATPQYYPLTHTTFWIEYHLWGLDTTGYHAVNIALHAISALLIWLILTRLAIPGAWFIAAVFVLHPLEVESVAWITERKNVLAGVFFFGGILSYLRFAGIGTPATPAEQTAPDHLRASGPVWVWYALSLLLFCCAGLSKTTAVSMPAVLILLLWWKRRLNIKHLLLLLPMLIVGIGLSRITSWMEIQTVGAEGADWMHTPAQRVLIAGRAVWFYAGKVFWPTHLSFMYPQWSLDVSSVSAWMWPISAVVVLVGLALLALKRRGPLVAVLYFVGTLTPALGFFNVYPMRFSFVADHFQYLSGIGLITLAVAVLLTMVRRMAGSSLPVPWRNGGALAGALILLSLGGLTWVRAHVYESQQVLWEDTLARNPQSWLASFNLAVTLNNRAVADLKAMGQADTDDARQLTEQANADRDRAMTLLQQTIALKPSMSRAHLLLGELLAGRNQWARALHELDLAIEADPNWYGSYRTRAKIHLHMGDLAAAESDYRKAIDAYQQARQRAIARLGSFYAAREMHPAFAWPHLEYGRLLANQGKLEQAMEQFNMALTLRPAWAPALHERGLIFARMGKLDEARNDLLEAIRQDPKETSAMVALAYVEYESGHAGIAVEYFRRALALSPQDQKARDGLELAVSALRKLVGAPKGSATPSSGPTTLPRGAAAQ